MNGITLGAWDLWSRHGFSDGDVVLEYIHSNDLDDLLKTSSAKPALVLLVQRHLLPALPRPVKTYIISSIHNPIRVEESEGDTPPVKLRNFHVKVTHEQVLQALKESPRDAPA